MCGEEPQFVNSGPRKSLVDLRHYDLSPLNACSDQFVRPRASLWSAE